MSLPYRKWSAWMRANSSEIKYASSRKNLGLIIGLVRTAGYTAEHTATQCSRACLSLLSAITISRGAKTSRVDVSK